MIPKGLVMSPPAALGFKIILTLSFVGVVFLYCTTPFQPRGDSPAITPFRNTSVVPVRVLGTNHAPPPKQSPQLPATINYGSTQCLPDITEEFIQEAVAWNSSCESFAPFGREPSPRIAKVMLHYGKMKDHYKRALNTHVLHSMIHNTDLHIECNALSEDWKLYNKQAFILRLLLEQLTLPKEERYEWLVWFDLDTVVLDQCRPLSTFLPPLPTDDSEKKISELAVKREEDKDDSVNLISAEDGNGLNDGVFFIRVSAWSVELMEAVLARHFYKPDEQLRFSEQSAMLEVLKSPRFVNNNYYVPQSWFNAFPNSDFGPEKYASREDEENLADFQARRGDFVLHFAGDWNKTEPMMQWMDIVEKTGNLWEKGRIQRDASFDVKEFWRSKGFWAEE